MTCATGPLTKAKLCQSEAHPEADGCVKSGLGIRDRAPPASPPRQPAQTPHASASETRLGTSGGPARLGGLRMGAQKVGANSIHSSFVPSSHEARPKASNRTSQAGYAFHVNESRAFRCRGSGCRAPQRARAAEKRRWRQFSSDSKPREAGSEPMCKRPPTPEPSSCGPLADLMTAPYRVDPQHERGSPDFLRMQSPDL